MTGNCWQEGRATGGSHLFSGNSPVSWLRMAVDDSAVVTLVCVFISDYVVGSAQSRPVFYPCPKLLREGSSARRAPPSKGTGGVRSSR